MTYKPLGLSNAKAILDEDWQWYYLTFKWRDKGVHTFSKSIKPKVNLIARLEFELAYFESSTFAITLRGLLLLLLLFLLCLFFLLDTTCCFSLFSILLQLLAISFWLFLIMHACKFNQLLSQNRNSSKL